MIRQTRPFTRLTRHIYYISTVLCTNLQFQHFANGGYSKFLYLFACPTSSCILEKLCSCRYPGRCSIRGGWPESPVVAGPRALDTPTFQVPRNHANNASLYRTERPWIVVENSRGQSAAFGRKLLRFLLLHLPCSFHAIPLCRPVSSFFLNLNSLNSARLHLQFNEFLNEPLRDMPRNPRQLSSHACFLPSLILRYIPYVCA